MNTLALCGRTAHRHRTKHGVTNPAKAHTTCGQRRTHAPQAPPTQSLPRRWNLEGTYQPSRCTGLQSHTAMTTQR